VFKRDVNNLSVLDANRHIQF